MNITQFPDTLQLLLGFSITLFTYILGKYTTKYFPRVPSIIFAIAWLVVILWLCHWKYDHYIDIVQPLFNHLLGYVTVALAIPLAAMHLDDVPLKPLCGILLFASIVGVVFPMGLAYLLHLSEPNIMAFATRALTTPVALNIAEVLHSPIALVTLIVIVSGIVGAVFSSPILKNINDERAAGLAMGLAAHAIGTAQAWQRSMVAGRYAALGMALNAIITSLWLPVLYILFFK